jgi:hypothetical protein
MGNPMSQNPYSNLPNQQFWAKSIGSKQIGEIDPVSSLWSISKDDKIATTGSCFAQHIARTLQREGYNYLVTEQFTGVNGTTDENYSVFPARFGNVYTTKQLVQLIDRAFGGRILPPSLPTKSKSGSFVDLYRPRVQTNGYASAADVNADAEYHLDCTRRMFLECNILIFTLGLTEHWRRKSDGVALPLAPGVVTEDRSVTEDVEFHNSTFTETLSELADFYQKLRSVNAGAKLLLTVSPVPLIATYEPRSVLVSTIASKSILRAAVDEFCRSNPKVSYFPSYEMVTGPHAPPHFYEPDRRNVSAAGVAFVMERFKRHYLNVTETAPLVAPSESIEQMNSRFADLTEVVCDEEAIVAALKQAGIN